MENAFQFKQFKVYHHQSTLKVGTDAILLGAWADINNTEKILEIGSGCGVISLMLAQRTNAFIDAIDIDKKSCEEAIRNVEISPWQNQIKISNISFQNYYKTTEYQYDLIISNPPFFSNSLKSSDINKNLAKHNDNLSFDELAKGIYKLLKNKGKAYIILPVNEAERFKLEASKQHLHCQKEIEIYTSVKKPISRLLMQFGKDIKFFTKEKLRIMDGNQNYTPDFKNLTKDYYLHS